MALAPMGCCDSGHMGEDVRPYGLSRLCVRCAAEMFTETVEWDDDLPCPACPLNAPPIVLVPRPELVTWGDG